MNNTLSIVISIFLLLLVGYGSKKVGILSRKDSPAITSLIINLTMPALIFTALHGKPINCDMVKAPFLFFAAELVVMCVALLVASMLKLNRQTAGGLILASAFGNTGCLGYPVITAAFSGHQLALPAAVIMDQFAVMAMVGIIGVAVAACFAGSKFQLQSLLEFLRTPIFPTTILALILRNVHIPQCIMSALGYLGSATMALAMISVGLGLSTESVRQYPAALAAAVVLKMLLMPALVLVAMHLAGVDGIVNHTGIVLGALPCSIMSGVIANRYGTNGAFVAGGIALTTLISIVWVPVVLILLH